MKFEYLKNNWSQITFVLMAIIFATTFYVETKTLKVELSDHIKEQNRVDAQIIKEIQEAIKVLNEEDDGVRGDFEVADKAIRELEDMRERALKAELLLAIEKSK